MRAFDLVLPVLSVALVGCQAEKFGEACDGFFANGCKAPLTCMNDSEGKYCSQSCSINEAFPAMSTKCPDDAECVQASYKTSSASGPMGFMCARPPKKR